MRSFLIWSAIAAVVLVFGVVGCAATPGLNKAFGIEAKDPADVKEKASEVADALEALYARLAAMGLVIDYFELNAPFDAGIYALHKTIFGAGNDGGILLRGSARGPQPVPAD